MRRAAIIGLSLLGLACTTTSSAQASPARPVLPKLRLLSVGQFDRPVALTAPRSDASRLFVVERAGVIRVIRNGVRLARPFLDFSGRVDSQGEERGTLSMALAPDYNTSGLLYVAYTALDGTIMIEEYRRSPVNPDVADPSSRRIVLAQPHPNRNHNSGQLQFGPDGKLHIGIGDGGGSGDRHNYAQDLGVRFGKILRINTRPGLPFIPRDNPLLNVPHARPEIYAYGLRNPWRFSFDRATGALTIGDVGQDEVEEIDYLPKGQTAGKNFGWHQCEGNQAFPPTGNPRTPCTARRTVRPQIVHRHADGYCAIIGGYIVRDRSLGSLYGRYLYGDWCQPSLRTARLGVPAALRDDRSTRLRLVALTAFGEDAGGCLYAMSLSGQVSRITATSTKTRPGHGKVACTRIPHATDRG